MIACIAVAACGRAAPADRMREPALAVQQEAELEAWIGATYRGARPIRYQSSQFDLDGDGAPETLLYVAAPGECGADGCSLYVLKQGRAGFEQVLRTTVTQLPLGVLDSSTAGWRDLWVTVSGDGPRTSRRRLAFDGTAYPADPSALPAVRFGQPAAHALIDEQSLIRLD